MSLIDTIRKDMFMASKEGRSSESDILKMSLAAIKNAEISSDKELTEADVELLLRKEVKKIQDSITQYTEMERMDLVENEKAQLEVLNKYLPELMGAEEVEEIVKTKIEELGAKDKRDMGRVMGTVMKELSGKADGALVKNTVDKLLA